MRRRLLVVGLGIGFLVLLTTFGTIITSLIPHRTTPSTQTAQAGPYHLTLQVDPNPPSTSTSTTLSVQVLDSIQQPVLHAHVVLESNMQEMNMALDAANAQPHNDGTYSTSVQFAMSGTWQVRVTISVPGTPSASAVFEVSVG